MNEKKENVNILYVVPSLSQCNGVASYAINYYKNMENLNIDFILARLSTKSSYFKEIEENGDKIYDLSREKFKNFFEYVRKTKKFFEKNAAKYDIIHCHVSNMGFLYLYYAKKYGIKIRILHSHATNSGETFFKKIRNDIFLKISKFYANYYFACSNYAGKAMFNDSKFTIINNAIDVERFKFDKKNRDDYRKKLNVEDKIVLANVGRLCYQKNQIFLITAFSKLPNKENYRLILIGNGPLKEKIIKKINELNLEKYVKLINTSDEIDKFYSAFDVLLMPSFYEGLPITGVEAQANGLPCLFSNKITDEIKLNENVKFLSINNYDKWIENIKDNNFTRCELINNVNKKFNIIAESKKLERLYLEMLKGKYE